MRPKNDIGKSQMIYPTEKSKGKIAYLLRENATSEWEKAHRLYVAMDPEKPLKVFLARDEIADEIAPRTFDPDKGEVRAYA